MKVLFLGTGEIAIPSFKALAESDYDLVRLVTQPDKPVGRSGKPQPPAIKVVAQENGIPVFQPEKIRAQDSLEALRALNADLMVVMAYGQILPQALIEMPSKAIINLHASLLPKYRGASCIQAAIANGDSETGWSVMHVVKALDAGDIIEVLKTSIEAHDTGESVHDRLAEMGPEILLKVLSQFEKDETTRIPQDESAVIYAPKMAREDARLDWSQSAEVLERQVRALHSWPGTFAFFKDAKGREKRLKIFPQVRIEAVEGDPSTILEKGEGGFVVACQEGALRIFEVQPEGGRRMSGEEFLRGFDIKALI